MYGPTIIFPLSGLTIFISSSRFMPLIRLPTHSLPSFYLYILCFFHVLSPYFFSPLLCNVMQYPNLIFYFLSFFFFNSTSILHHVFPFYSSIQLFHIFPPINTFAWITVYIILFSVRIKIIIDNITKFLINFRSCINCVINHQNTTPLHCLPIVLQHWPLPSWSSCLFYNSPWPYI